MSAFQKLFQKKLQELKEKPHKRFDNNEDDAASREFITPEVLGYTTKKFGAFLKSFDDKKQTGSGKIVSPF